MQQKNIYRDILQKAPFGYFYSKIHTDDSGNPIDYVLLEVNEVFNELTGLGTKEEVEGKTARELVPDIEAESFNWIQAFGKVAIEQTDDEFVQYFESLERWYKVQAYSPEKYYFVVIFTDISSHKEDEEKLLVQKERLDSIIESTHAGTWAYNHQDDSLIVNERWAAMFGYTTAEVSGNTKEFFDNHIHPDDKTMVEESWNHHLHGETQHYEVVFRLRRKDNQYIWVHARGEQSKYHNEGEPIWIYGANHDITERKEAENALLESEKRYRELYERTPVMLHSSDGNSRIISVTDQWLETMEYEREEVVGNVSLSFLTPESREIVRSDKFPLFKKTGSIFNVPLQFVTKSGKILDVLLSATSERDENNVVSRTLVVLIDVTDKKRAEAKLHEQRRVLKDILEDTLSGYWDFNIAEGKEYLSPQFKRILGYTKEELKGETNVWKKLIFPDDYEKNAKKYEEHVASKGEIPFRHEIRYQHKNGSVVWVISTGRVIEWDSEGNPARMVGCNVDITDQKNIQAQFQAAKETAERASKVKSEFLANMSHEIRTPLNGVIGFAELLKNTPLIAVQQQYIDVINNSALLLLGVINDILDFSKIESGKLELEMIKTDLLTIVEQAADVVTYQASEKGVELLLNVAPDLPRFIVTDPVRLKQVVVNLLSNAVKFTSKGEVELSLHATIQKDAQATFTFAIRDTGIGISKDKQKTLFQAFTQADTSTTRKFGGTGLGLVIANHIVQRMGSEGIKLDSVIGKGSTFSFSITSEFESGEKLNTTSLSSIRKVLIIDDNPNNSKILERTLEHWGIACRSCDNGLEAIKILDSEEFDIAIVDYHMPYIDGLETMKMIREKLQLPAEKLKLILLHSSTDDSSVHDTCQQLQVRFILSKPITSQELFQYLCRIDEDGNIHRHSKPTSKKVRLSETDTSTILIAEDNSVNMLLAVKLLQDLLPKATILKAVNGVEAVSLFQEHKPDLILMDIQMPEMDGVEATRCIRSSEEKATKRTPILALTAGAFKELREQSIIAGLDDFIAKPIDKVTLMNSLSTYLNISTESVQESVESQPEIYQRSYFDEEKFSDKIDNNSELFTKLLTLTVDQINQQLQEINSFLEEADYASAKSTVHALKGLAWNMCLNRVGDIAKDFQNALDTDNVNLEEVQHLNKTIRDAWDETNRLLTPKLS